MFHFLVREGRISYKIKMKAKKKEKRGVLIAVLVFLFIMGILAVIVFIKPNSGSITSSNASTTTTTYISGGGGEEAEVLAHLRILVGLADLISGVGAFLT
jgi:hypothetical protein